MTDFSVGILVGVVMFAAFVSGVYLIIHVRRKKRKRPVNENEIGSGAGSITGNIIQIQL